MSISDATERREVVVVGGGQAGLAMGYYLAQQGRAFTILEAAAEPAAAWRERWDSLKLFTPVRYSGLPGLPFPGDPDSYPTRDQVADYLSDYARRFELPVELDSRVRAIRKTADGYLVELDDRAYKAEQVVVATGPSRRRSCRRSPRSSARMSSSCIAPPTATRSRSLRAPCSLLAAGTLASRSPRSWSAHTRCTWRSAPPDPAAAADPWTRPVLVPERDRADPQDDRVTHRPAAGGPRHADWLQP